MQLATGYTVAFFGVQSRLIELQVQLARGLPAFNIVGLADKAVAESKERIKACMYSLGIEIPALRITVNLAPADLQKEGSHYDLPIALALLEALRIIPEAVILEYLVLGEITLDGRILKVPGVLPAALLSAEYSKNIVCPNVCGAEASWAGNDVRVLAPERVLELIRHFNGEIILPQPTPSLSDELHHYPDMSDVKAQGFAKRGLEIAAAGGHNVLMIGPPGSGKSMLAARLPGILPALTPKEALDVTVVHSLAGIAPKDGLVKERPFRDPHHSASLPALVGGGQKGKPGEISLAHNGVLFLDELPEFSRACLESLRQPLETGTIAIARVRHHYTYPARFQFVAAMNPCKCGYFGDIERQCGKAPKCAEDYMGRLSGPLLDRFDLVIPVSALKPDELQAERLEESSASILARVRSARQAQSDRYKDDSAINARVDGAVLDDATRHDEVVSDILKKAIERFKLSARGYRRLLRVTRTIADLEGGETIRKHHALEAINYRLR